MLERFSWKRVTSVGLAAFVVFIMVLSSFVGAVGPEEKSEPTFDSGVDEGAPDSPGSDLEGISLTSEMAGADQLMPTNDGIGSGFMNALTPSGDIISGSLDMDSSLGFDEPTEASGHFDEIGEESNVKTYNNILTDVVNNYIISEVPNSESHDHSGGADLSSSLYSTVTEYLDDGADQGEPEFEDTFAELAKNGLTADKEILDKRTAESRSYRNADGTVTAIIFENPVHYQDDSGNWQEIDVDLEISAEGDYENTKNLIRSRFNYDTSEVVVDIGGADTAVSWTPVSMSYMDVYGLSHDISDARNSVASVDGNKIRYDGTFQSTDEEYTIMGGQIKHNLILSEMPAQAINGLYLSYVGMLTLADGLEIYVDGVKVTSVIETQSDIEIRGADGETILFLPAPVTYESEDGDTIVAGSYRIEAVGGGYLLSINTPVEWLNDPDRQYPVVIDPFYVTRDVYRYRNGYLREYKYVYNNPLIPTRYTYYRSTTSHPYIGYQVNRYSTYTRYTTWRDYIRYNTASIPDGKTIVDLDWRTYYHGYGSNFGAYVREMTTRPDYSSSSMYKADFKGFDTAKFYYTSYDVDPTGLYKTGKTEILSSGYTYFNNLNKLARNNLMANLPVNYFYIGIHRAVEAGNYGYGYLHPTGSSSYLRVTYDDCPRTPVARLDGPYSVPEGTKTLRLDASASLYCGSPTVLIDIGNDGTTDGIATLPNLYWDWTPLPTDTYNFVDETTGTIQIKMTLMDVTTTILTSTYYSYYDVYNVAPEILGPATQIVGDEGTTITFKPVRYTDPGVKDSQTYWYDLNGNNLIDDGPGTYGTIAAGAPQIVPAVSMYFCDGDGRPQFINLTIDDNDGGTSDFLETQNIYASYDGDLNHYYRPSDYPYYYGRTITYSSSSYTTLYLRYYAGTSYIQDSRPFFMFNTRYVPSGVTITGVQLRTYLDYVAYGGSSTDYGGKVGVNDIDYKPSQLYSTSDMQEVKKLYDDSDSTNILASGNSVTLKYADQNKYHYWQLNPADFTSKRASHSSWYGVGLDRYDTSDEDFYMHFDSGSRNQLRISYKYPWSSSTYYYYCYPYGGSSSNPYGVSGYTYFREYWGRYLYTTTSSSSSTYSYLQINEQGTSTYYNQLPLMKFDSGGIPSTFTPTKVTLRSYMGYISSTSLGGGGKVTVNDVSVDPHTTTGGELAGRKAVYNDAQSGNVMLGPDKYVDLPYGTPYGYKDFELDPADFIQEHAAHPSYYALAFDRYDETPQTDKYFYMRFRMGGTYTTLTLDDGTTKYELRLYTYTDPTTYRQTGYRGYTRHQWLEGMDSLTRSDTSSYAYHRDKYYTSYSELTSKSFFKFGTPGAHPSKILSITGQVRMYTPSPRNLYTGMTKNLIDPETATDKVLFDAIKDSSPQIYTYSSYTYITLPYTTAEYTSIFSSSDWFAFGFKKNSGNSAYGRTYTANYGTTSYRPQLIVTHRVPWQLPIYVRNVDPVLSGTPILSKSIVDEGEIVHISGLSFTDQGKCDTHEYRVVVYAGTMVNIALPWTATTSNILDFDFPAPDDDPEDGDSDITQDTVRITIEVRDDNYEATLKWDKVELELSHDYYYNTYTFWNQPWGVYEQLAPWQETTDHPILGKRATWNNFPKATTVKSTPESTVSTHIIYSDHWDKWDVTSLAKSWISSPGNNNGMRVMPTFGTWSPNVMRSSDYSSTYRPKLSFTPTNPAIPSITMQPGPVEGKDAMVRYSPSSEPYGDTNYGTYSYIIQTQDYVSSPYMKYETNAMLEFDLTNLPMEHAEWGLDQASALLTIKNVKPGIDSSGVKIMVDGEERSYINESEPFQLVNITIDDPAAGQPTEVFEYRYKIDNGTYSTWEVLGGGGATLDYKVVPNAFEDPSAPGIGGNYWPWTIYSGYRPRRYMQFYDSSQFGGTAGWLKSIGFRPYYNPTTFDTHFWDLKMYLMSTSKTGLDQKFSNNFGADRTLVFSSSDFNYVKTDPALDDFMMIELDTPFNYNGVSNLIWEMSFRDGSGTQSIAMDIVNGPLVKRIWAFDDPNADMAYAPEYNDGLVTKFEYGAGATALPPINLFYPDDHPKTGTPSDTYTITVELRDDDMIPGDKATATTTFTVNNVAPELEPGEILVDGVINGGSGATGFLETIWNANNGQNGNMFDVTAKKSLKIEKFDIHIRNTNSYTAEVYYRKGGYSGFETNAGAWTKLGSAPVTGAGTGMPTPLLVGGLKMFAGETYGLYVTLTSGSVGYTNGLNTYQNADMSLTSGVGKSYPFGSTFNPRTWNGKIYYGGTSTEEYDAELDEGQEVTLQDWDILDPAEGVPTETFKYQIDWGDGVIGPLTDVVDGINPVPKEFTPNDGTDGYILPLSNYLPLLFGGTGAIQQVLFTADEMPSSAKTWQGLQYYIRNPTQSVGTTLDLKNFRLRLGHLPSTTTALSTTFANNVPTGVKTVFSSTKLTLTMPAAGAPVPFTFSAPFTYDGSSALFMEVTWNVDSTCLTAHRWFQSDQKAGCGYNDYMSATQPVFTPVSGIANYRPITTFIPKPFTSTGPFTHLYRDDPAVGDYYFATIHVWDDDTGHGTFELKFKVNNVKPTIDLNDQALGLVMGKESTGASLVLPSANFEDNGTQYDISNPNEIWTYWWDIDGNGLMNNAPDVVGIVPQSLVKDLGTDGSDGLIPSVTAMVPDDYINRPLALYLFDDDMTHALSSNATSATGTMTVHNVAPVASIEVFIPMEVRVRMAGRMENDLMVEIMQKDSRGQTRVYDAMIIERMPGPPKNNPFADGTPSAPLLVKADPGLTMNVVVTFDATPDPNDIHTPKQPIGSDPVWVYLDFPLEDDYDPVEDSQSSTGHHWAQSFKFNSQKGATQQVTVDATSALDDRWTWLIGHSTDDSSDDAAFYWTDNSGTSPLSSSNNIVYYNDGTTSPFNVPPGPTYKDGYPTPWTGTAPCHYEDTHLFRYSTGFSVSLYTVDDDDGRDGVSGKSNVATYLV